MKTPALAALLAATLGLPALAQDSMPTGLTREATGTLVTGDGTEAGEVMLATTESGLTVVTVQAEGVPEGVHGVHFHMVGTCDGPTFESAGGHLASEGHDHGTNVPMGPHEGDLPNGHVQADGTLAMEAFAVGLTDELVFDADGTALIVHADPDDYVSQPSGNAGDRLMCAVMTAVE